MDQVIESLGFLFAKFTHFLPVVGVVAGLTLVEFVWPRERYSLRSRLDGLEFAFVTALLAGLFVFPVQWLAGKLFGGPLVTIAFLPAPVALLAGIVLLDFLKYWEHRFEHRFAWPVHAVHHSPTELHAANTYAHPLARTIEAALIYIPASLIDFGSPAMPFLLVLFFNFQVQALHSSTRLNLGPLRAVFVDNMAHRYHHSDNPEHFDKNFGVLLSIWDRIFGTWHEPKRGEELTLGVKEYPPAKSLTGFLLLPLLNVIRNRKGARLAGAPSGGTVPMSGSEPRTGG